MDRLKNVDFNQANNLCSLHLLILDSDIDEVFVNPNLFLKKIQPSDLLDWFGFVVHESKPEEFKMKSTERLKEGAFDSFVLRLSGFTEFSLLKYNYALICLTSEVDNQINIFNKAISIFRTCSTGVNYSLTPSTCSSFYPQSGWSFLPPASFKASDLEKFLNLSDSIRNNSSKKFDTLLERYRHAIQQGLALQDRNRFIDLIGLLEMMFVPDGKSGEISYKFRMRSARYLSGKVLKTPAELFDFFKEMYNVRSKFVHGDVQNLVPADLKFMIEVVRQSLLSYLESSEDFEAKTLDQLLLLG